MKQKPRKTGFSHTGVACTFDGKYYPSFYQAAKQNVEKTGIKFETLYRYIREGGRTTEVVQSRKQRTSFVYEGKEYKTIKKCAEVNFYSESRMRGILKEAGIR